MMVRIIFPKQAWCRQPHLTIAEPSGFASTADALAGASLMYLLCVCSVQKIISKVARLPLLPSRKAGYRAGAR
jgi:hypothetical protein